MESFEDPQLMSASESDPGIPWDPSSGSQAIRPSASNQCSLGPHASRTPTLTLWVQDQRLLPQPCEPGHRPQ